MSTGLYRQPAPPLRIEPELFQLVASGCAGLRQALFPPARPAGSPRACARAPIFRLGLSDRRPGLRRDTGSSALDAAANSSSRLCSALRHRPAGNLQLASKTHLPARPVRKFPLRPDFCRLACAAGEYPCSAFPSSPKLHRRSTFRLAPAFASLAVPAFQLSACAVGCTFWPDWRLLLRLSPAVIPSSPSGDSRSHSR